MALVLNQDRILQLRRPLNNDGLVGRWCLDDQVTDFSGQQTTGTPVNAPKRAGGLTGSALLFNGSSQYISLPTTAFPLLFAGASGGKFTVLSWVYMTTTSGAFGGTILKNWGSGTGGFIHWDVESGAPTLYVSQLNDSVKGPVTASTISLNTWHRLVALADGTNISIYVDGVISGAPVSYDGTLKTSFVYTNIGAKPSDAGGADGSNPGYMDGILDNVCVYNRALSIGEIVADYNSVFQSWMEGEMPVLLASIAATTGLRYNSSLSGLGASGPFFHDRLSQ